MRLLNTLYVTEHGARVGLRKGSLAVKLRDGRERRVPINAVDTVVLLGRAQPSAELLAECSRRNIRVAALTRYGRVRFVVAGPTGGSVHLRLEQYRRATEAAPSAQVARTVVAGKLQNCRRMLQRWEWDAPARLRSLFADQRGMVEERLRALEGSLDGDRIRGIEGDGTRRYFRGLALHLGSQETSVHFAGRSRRPPRDPVNAVLSFAYGLLLTEAVGALEAAGLDPQIGFLHQPRSGRPALALDLVKEFRPAFGDRFGIAALMRGQLTDDDFVRSNRDACHLNDEGRRKFIEAFEEFKSEEVFHPVLGRDLPRWSALSVQATLMARHVRGDLADYPPFTLAG
ncbi:CRISPR-associated endonuclease Cas1 [Egibacter rhizosphaerae]|uniref:CRISPR-associated endonuclease Cas1 n=1 Tax=Egibacter rhizosphaerae TaxID=1670831 RepID=UPI0013F14BE8|nr:CRISPR-associated endonuclease Cas1 [Egibacter rhizosphaerae]